MADAFKRVINNLKHQFSTLKQQERAKLAHARGNPAHNINFKAPTNIKVSENSHQPGGITVSNSSQNSPVNQENSSSE